MSNIREQFGKPKDGGTLNVITLKENDTKTVRFPPPMGSLKETGAYGVYIKQHYGYSVTDPRDPTKARMRPFLCIEESELGGLVTVSCPECIKIANVTQTMKDRISQEVERLRKLPKPIVGGEAEKLAKESVKDDSDWLQSHNLDKKWLCPVMLEDGSYGLLKIPHAGHKAVDKARKQLKFDENRDIFDMDAGAWVKITRTGTGRSTEYDAVVVKEAVALEGGQRAMVTKSVPLSDEHLQKFLDLPDVNGPVVVRRLSAGQIRMLAEGGGSPAEVEAVMNLSSRVGPSTANSEGTENTTPPPPASRTVLTPQVATTVATTVPTTVASTVEIVSSSTEEEDDEALALRALSEARERKARAKAAAALPKVVAAENMPAISSSMNVSDEEFLRRFPPPKR